MKTKDFKDKVLSLTGRIYPMVARMLNNRENAEDAVQEIMIKLWDRRKKIEQHPNIPAYVFLTARNYCLDLLKKNHPEMDSSEELSLRQVSETSHNQLEWKELKTIIESILNELPDQQCEILKMRDLDGLEYNEIAEIMDLKIKHIRVLLSRARKHVGMKLKNIYSYE
jgi:RNA polymerase sigma factor (sigma-70 family)